MLPLCPDNQEWSILQLSVVIQPPLMLCVSRQMVGSYDLFFTLLILTIILVGELIASAGDGKRI
jgi:hypothetical protein